MYILPYSGFDHWQTANAVREMFRCTSGGCFLRDFVGKSDFSFLLRDLLCVAAVRRDCLRLEGRQFSSGVARFAVQT